MQGPVAAYPLPPDYFEGLTDEEIRGLAPPEVSLSELESFETFSQTIMRGGEWQSILPEEFNHIGDLGSKPINDLCGMLRELKEGTLGNYLQLLTLLTRDAEATQNEACLKDFRDAQGTVMAILGELRRRQAGGRVADELESLIAYSLNELMNK